MKYDFKELFAKQKALDILIGKNHNIDYASTRKERTLALLVEIGEFANSTRCFKFWSNKGSEEKSRVLDEYADGMHFFLSLGIDINCLVTEFTFNRLEGKLTDQIINCYNLISDFANKYDAESYVKAFSYFLSISLTLDFDINEVVNAYEIKLKENYHRQDTNY